MNSRALRWLVYTELLLTVREPAAMFMSVILPLASFLALGFSVGDMEIEVTRDSGNVDLFHVRDVLLAGNIAWVTAVFGIIALPQALVEFRQHGVFRRYRITPYQLLDAVPDLANCPIQAQSGDGQGHFYMRPPHTEIMCIECRGYYLLSRMPARQQVVVVDDFIQRQRDVAPGGFAGVVENASVPVLVHQFPESLDAVAVGKLLPG